MSMAALQMDEAVVKGEEGLQEGLEAVKGKNMDGKTQPINTLAGRRPNGDESFCMNECHTGIIANAFAEAPELEGSRAQDTGGLTASRSRTTRSTAKQGKLSMSPTEQDIRESLRRSAKARRA